MIGSPPEAVIFDHTVLLTMGAGHRLLSGLVAQAHRRPDSYVYAPALCLTAAIAQRPGLADHIGVLPAIRVIDLDYAAAVVGCFIAAGVDWRAAHAIDAGRPTAEWPAGRPILTATPETYGEWGVAVISVI